MFTKKSPRAYYGIDNIPKFILWYMYLSNRDSIVLGRFVYYISVSPQDSLIYHKEMHLQQIERDGFFMFHIKYLWYNISLGSTDNPYEIEARGPENNIKR